MKDITDDEQDNNQFIIKQFLQQHNFFIENVLKKLFKYIQHIYNNVNKFFKIKEHIILQQEKKCFFRSKIYF